MSRPLYYALGGGLGHITRARALLRQWGEPARILTRADLAEDQRLADGLDLIAVPVELEGDARALAVWLRELLFELRPPTLYLDSFPVGLFGEFRGLELPAEMRLVHIARLLRWKVYAQRIGDTAPRFERSYVLEPLAREHAAWLQRHSRELEALEIMDAPAHLDAKIKERFLALAAPRWLVVHAGSEDEVRELIEYARQQARLESASPSLCLVSPRPLADSPPEVMHLDCYPAQALFPLADRIISACGFNSMRQTLAYRDKHRFLPLPRSLDDQFARAAQRRLSEQKQLFQ